MLNEPWGVAVNDHDVIVVTEILNHRVSVFRSDGTYLRSFGKKGKNNGEFAEPSGITFDSLGNIVVADCENHRVQVFDRKGKFLRTFGQNGILDHQLKRPEGLSINGNGDIIVTDKGNKLIKIFSSSGEYLRKIGGVGSLVNPYHCIQHGQYLIVTDYGDDSIKMFDLEGKFISKFGKRGNKDGEFNKPHYLSVNKEGLLMVCDESNHRVQVFELTSGKFVTKFGSEGSGRGEFIFPVSTASLSDGRIVQLPCLHSFCLHCLKGIQQKSGLHGKITCPECKRQFEIPGSGNPSELPTNVRINSLLDVLTIKECSTANVKCGNCDKRMQKLGVKRTASSEAIAGNKRPNVRDSPLEARVQTKRYIPVLSFGREGKSAGMLKGPSGVAVNDRDEIAVTELWNNRISLFSSDGTHLRSFGRKGENNSEFNAPSGIAFDSLGNIIVTDCKTHRVQVFDRNGKFLRKFGEYGSLDHQLTYPEGLSINGNGDIIVADRTNKLIKIFSSTGEYLRKFGRAGSLVSPYHCIQHGQYLIVSDYGDDSIKMFDLEGKFISKFGKQGEKDGEFNKPRYLSVNKQGLLMVCDSFNHRVQLFELSGKFVTKFGNEGSERGEFNYPVSTANLSDGRIVTLLDNLHDEVSCSVCMCTYTDPKQLPCLNSTNYERRPWQNNMPRVHKTVSNPWNWKSQRTSHQFSYQ
ncbi:unnamed protein product [Porites lobata]|uniref:RING-type domain-containing protein n=1 Tax=Porites lobata TaxID=104759 RepID=A0ABN8MYH5_9CNID|nr:unnamed protein product [Porites lobata]